LCRFAQVDLDGCRTQPLALRVLAGRDRFRLCGFLDIGEYLILLNVVQGGVEPRRIVGGIPGTPFSLLDTAIAGVLAVLVGLELLSGLLLFLRLQSRAGKLRG
jgi:hypothetical protein